MGQIKRPTVLNRATQFIQTIKEVIRFLSNIRINTFMLGDNFDKYGDKRKQYSSSEYYVVDTGSIHNNINTQRTPNRMEPKILIAFLYLVGIPTYILGILENYGNWKGDILFIIAVLFGIAKLVFFCLRQWQMFLLRKGALKEKKIASENKKKHGTPRTSTS